MSPPRADRFDPIEFAQRPAVRQAVAHYARRHQSDFGVNAVDLVLALELMSQAAQALGTDETMIAAHASAVVHVAGEASGATLEQRQLVLDAVAALHAAGTALPAMHAAVKAALRPTRGHPPNLAALRLVRRLAREWEVWTGHPATVTIASWKERDERVGGAFIQGCMASMAALPESLRLRPEKLEELLRAANRKKKVR